MYFSCFEIGLKYFALKKYYALTQSKFFILILSPTSQQSIGKFSTFLIETHFPRGEKSE